PRPCRSWRCVGKTVCRRDEPVTPLPVERPCRRARARPRRSRYRSGTGRAPDGTGRPGDRRRPAKGRTEAGSFTERPDFLSRETEKCVSSPTNKLSPAAQRRRNRPDGAGARHAQLRRLQPCVSAGAPLVAVLPPRLPAACPSQPESARNREPGQVICRCVVFGGRPGYVPVRRETELEVFIGYAPCPDCMGSGIVSCCD